MNLEKKTTGFSFGFSKTKQKTTVIQTQAFKEELKKTDEQKVELITSLEGKKVQSLNQPKEIKKPIVIPCQQNSSLLDTVKNKRLKESSSSIEKKISNSNDKTDDLEAVKALIADSKQIKEVKDDKDLKIPINSNNEKKSDDLENVEDANYEAIDLEQFGKAALRGMGWNEKEGIGLTNKRSFNVVEFELRPKGLGLGAGFGKKQKTSSDDTGDNDSSLKYRKGAYVEILTGKFKDEIAQIVSFDDGLNRILVKLVDDNQTVSLLQNFTRLISKSDYENMMKKKRK